MIKITNDWKETEEGVLAIIEFLLLNDENGIGFQVSLLGFGIVIQL